MIFFRILNEKKLPYENREAHFFILEMKLTKLFILILNHAWIFSQGRDWSFIAALK